MVTNDAIFPRARSCDGAISSPVETAFASRLGSYYPDLPVRSSSEHPSLPQPNSGRRASNEDDAVAADGGAPHVAMG